MTNNCLNCGKKNPPSKGNRKRKYCSKKCAGKYYTKTERYYKRENDDWGTRTAKRMQEREDRKAQFEWHQTNMYTAMRIEEDFGMLYSTAWVRSKYLGIEGKVITGGPNGGSHKFFTYDEVQRILHEEITPEHNNEYVRKIRRNARLRRRNVTLTPEQKKARNKRDTKRRRERKAENPAYKLSCNVSSAVYTALVKRQGRTKGGSTFEHLPYTPAELKEHIEKQFDEHMSWDNYGTYWNVDHIIPQAALVYDSLKHPNFQKCWALSNLRPLQTKLNSSKGSFYRGKRHNYSDDGA